MYFQKLIFPFSILILLVFMFSFSACGGKKKKNSESILSSSLPDSIMKREKFAQVMADILLAEAAVVQQYDPKESKLIRFEKYRYNIYKKHSMDSLVFRRNYEYYMAFPKRSELFLFIVEDTLEARKADSLRLE